MNINLLQKTAYQTPKVRLVVLNVENRILTGSIEPGTDGEGDDF